MLEWLTGSAKALGDGGPNRRHVDEASVFEEPPVTPAPVFAVRAFRNAIFGPPSESREPSPTRNEVRETTRDSAVEITKKTTISAVTLSEKDDHAQAALPRPSANGRESISSPTKLPGILLTPGTGPSRRKTVSFKPSPDSSESEIVIAPKDKEIEVVSEKLATAWTTADMASSSERRTTSLTKALYQSRSKATVKPLDGGRRVSGAADLATSSDALASGAQELDDLVPAVESACTGCYWRLELENYHEKAAHVVRRLLKYKHLAKQYARQKEEEAIVLGAQLQDAKDKIRRLEADKSGTAAPGPRPSLEDHDDTVAELHKAKDEIAMLRAENERLRKQLREANVRPASDKHRPEQLLVEDRSSNEVISTSRSAKIKQPVHSTSAAPERVGPSRPDVQRSPAVSSRPLGDLDINSIYDNIPARTSSSRGLTSTMVPSGAPEQLDSSDLLDLPSFEEPLYLTHPAPKQLTIQKPTRTSGTDKIDRVQMAKSPVPKQGSLIQSTTKQNAAGHHLSRDGAKPVDIRSKTTLPPDRLAAAKARLERKRAVSKGLVVE